MPRIKKSRAINAAATLTRAVTNVDNGDRFEGMPVNRVFSTESPDLVPLESPARSERVDNQNSFN